MRAPLIITLIAVVAYLLSPASSQARTRDNQPSPYAPPADEKLPPDLHDRFAEPQRSSAAADTFVLGSFTFDTVDYQPDPQGWISVDFTAQIDDFFHIAGPSELNGGQFGRLLPLEGNQSVWCGTVPSNDPPFCNYATLPGYGNDWEQYFVSKVFDCDSLRLDYKVRWDSEPYYDFTYVEYLDDASSTWTRLPVNGGATFYDDIGSLVESFGFATTNGTTRLRFRFDSDGSWSDEDALWPTDGAVLIDSVTVACFNGGVLTSTVFDDFEDELPGAKTTNDGSWFAQSAPGYGGLAALYPGIALLQDDPCFANWSFLWAFIVDPSIANYACHVPDPRPDQGVVPFGTDDGVYIENAIWSPKMPLVGSGSQFILDFMVYRDLPLNNLVFYQWKVRSWVDGCPGMWRDTNFVFYSWDRDWHLHEVGYLGSYIEPGATDIQISLSVIDMCPFWCSIFGTGQCHSNAPLFDNVRVLRVNREGPQFTAAHGDLFQDTFAEDGTLTGLARADMARDVTRYYEPNIRPGDSLAVTVADPVGTLGTDPTTGGPAVYAHVAVWPPGQPGKTPADLEAPETRAGVGKRYPLIGTQTAGGVTWARFRMDNVFDSNGSEVANRYCFDLDDSVFTPGDTICYFFEATNTSSQTSYFSRRFEGQGEAFTTDDLAEVQSSPMEFTVLPASGWQNGGNILYVDDADDRGGAVPLQLFFDSAYEMLGVSGSVDRYDVLDPSRFVGNSLESRVQDVYTQIIGCYKNIIWSSGSLRSGLIGDGTGSRQKADDFGLLFTYLDQHPDNPGLFITGDSNAQEWVNLYGPGAVALRSIYMDFSLVDRDHVSHDGQISPLLEGVSPTFTHLGVPDEIVGHGGCPVIDDFDVLQPRGTAQADLVNPQTGSAYLISQETQNVVSSTARVALSGFSLHHAHDNQPRSLAARAEILKDILAFFGNALPPASGVTDPAVTFTNHLQQNYPNPFNPVTTIRYNVKTRAPVSLKIYNAAGQLVKTLVDEVQSPRAEGFTVRWTGDGNGGAPVASGVYFYRLVTTDYSETKRMVLLK